MKKAEVITPAQRRRMKRHHTERFTGHPFKEKWPIEKSALIGFLTGLGLNSIEIEKEMADGTIAASIRGQWRRWRLPLDRVGGPKHRRVHVALTFHQKTKIAKQADARGLTISEYFRRMMVCAINDDMYAAIVGDRFEGK